MVLKVDTSYRRKPYTKKKYIKKYKRNFTSYAGKSVFQFARALASPTAHVATAVMKKALGLNTENKDFDSVLGATNATNVVTAVLFPTAGIPQGTTNNTRVGNGLRITHYKFRGSIQTVAANNAQQRIRMIWCINTSVSNPGQYTTAAQLLQNTVNIDSPYNTDLQDCKVLSDRTYLVGPDSGAQVAQCPFMFKWNPFYKLGHVQWTDADVAGLGANMTKGLLQLFIMSDQLVNVPIVSGYGRLHYVDN